MQLEPRRVCPDSLIVDERRLGRASDRIDLKAAPRRPQTRAEANRGDMALPDASERHDEAQATVRHAGLIGVKHGAWVEQRGRLECIFLGERGGEEMLPRLVER